MATREYPGKVDKRDEKRHYDVFARLNQLRKKHESGYRDAQNDCRLAMKEWLENHCPLSDDQYASALPVKICELPHGDLDGNYAVEMCAISERQIWWRIDDPGPHIEPWKEANKSYLVAKRQQVYADAEGNENADPDHKPYGWDKKNRRQRYDNLQIATKYGSAYEEWKKDHNDETGEKNPPPKPDTRHRLSEHFTVEEFDCHDGTKCQSRDYNGLESLCKTYLEPLRDKYGSVHINSGFRTHDYNAYIGGASGSFHVYTEHDGDDQAADIACASGSPSQWHAFLSDIRAKKRNGNGGLGLYSTFVHVDLRDYQSNWTG